VTKKQHDPTIPDSGSILARLEKAKAELARVRDEALARLAEAAKCEFMDVAGADIGIALDTIDRLRAELSEACEIAHLYRQLILLYNARMHLDRVDALLARQEKPT
jgi:hypothetical protein